MEVTQVTMLAVVQHVMEQMPSAAGSSQDAIQSVQSVPCFVYAVLNKFCGHATNMLALLIACAHHFATNTERSPVRYEMCQYKQALPLGDAGELNQVHVVEAKLHAQSGHITKGAVFDVLLCELAAPRDLEAIRNGTLNGDRVIHIKNGNKTMKLKPVTCRQYTSCSKKGYKLDAWYEIWRAPGKGVDLKHSFLINRHPRSNLRMNIQHVNDGSGRVLLFLVATSTIRNKDSLFWEYASSNNQIEVAQNAQHFSALAQQAQDRGYPVMLCRCELCCEQRASPPREWGPMVVYVDTYKEPQSNEHSSARGDGTDNGTSCALTGLQQIDFNIDAKLLAFFKSQAHGHGVKLNA